MNVGKSSTNAAPTAATVSKPPRNSLRCSALSVVIVEFLACFSLAAFFFFCFAVCLFERPPHHADRGSQPIAQPNQRENTVCVEFLVEPLAREQPDQDAQGELEADCSVPSD